MQLIEKIYDLNVKSYRLKLDRLAATLAVGIKCEFSIVLKKEVDMVTELPIGQTVCHEPIFDERQSIKSKVSALSGFLLHYVFSMIHCREKKNTTKHIFFLTGFMFFILSENTR